MFTCSRSHVMAKRFIEAARWEPHQRSGLLTLVLR
jgi:hypothetical protein